MQESAELLDPTTKISGERPEMLRTWFDRRHSLPISGRGRTVDLYQRVTHLAGYVANQRPFGQQNRSLQRRGWPIERWKNVGRRRGGRVDELPPFDGPHQVGQEKFARLADGVQHQHHVRGDGGRAFRAQTGRGTRSFSTLPSEAGRRRCTSNTAPRWTNQSRGLADRTNSHRAIHPAAREYRLRKFAAAASDLPGGRRSAPARNEPATTFCSTSDQSNHEI